MKNKFRLAKLIKYRKSLEDQKRIALAAVEEKLQKAKEELYYLRETQELCHESLNKTPEDARILLMCLNSSALRAFKQRKVIKNIDKEILDAKEELAEASKSRKIVEKLKDRHQQRLEKKFIKQERKYLDEVASIRYLRNKIDPYSKNV
ncbi:hypothetical protein GF312_08185 [Candidatus Poribacteria bacterium]|nr:hypothetical protein [Candidatus Poribacteria bacterium]